MRYDSHVREDVINGCKKHGVEAILTSMQILPNDKKDLIEYIEK